MKNCNETTSHVGEIILYQPDSSIRLEVMVEDETVWLTQGQMVVLFDSSKATTNLTLRKTVVINFYMMRIS